MGRFLDKLPDIVLPVLGVAGDSNAIDLKKYAHDADCLSFASLTGLDGNTYTILVSYDNEVSYQTLQILKSDGTLIDAPFPASAKSVTYPVQLFGGADHLKIHSSAAIVTTPKTITLRKIWR